MRPIVFSIFLVIVLTLTFQSITSAENGNQLTRKELATTIKPSAVGRLKGKNDGLMMNMSAAIGHKNDKGNNNALDNIKKIFDMCKTLVEAALMFVDPIFTVKNYGLSLIGTVITIAKFIMDLKKEKESKEKKQSWEVGNVVIDHRIGMPYGTSYSTGYRPTYMAPYPTYMHKYRMPMTS